MNRKRNRRYALALMFSLGLCSAGVSAAPAVVETGPLASHREVRQIWMRFSDDMVALGDDQAPDAATVACQGTDSVAKGHWLDSKRWVAEFVKPLPDGVACEVKPQALKSLKGEQLAAAPAWRFDTGGLSAHVSIEQSVYGFAKEKPIVAVEPSARPDESTLKYLGCKVNGEARAVSLLSGAARDAALKTIFETRKPQGDVPVLAMQCGADPWPQSAKIEIVWDARIASRAHVVNDKDQTYSFSVRPPFAASFTCSELIATPDCEPRTDGSRRLPPELKFSEKVDRRLAKQIVLVGQSGAVYKIASDTLGRDSVYFHFNGDLSSEQSVSLRLPEDLVDVDGRPLVNRAALAHPVALAKLPAFLGMERNEGVLPAIQGKASEWPVVTRGLEPEVPVRAWHFSSADIPALVSLHGADSPQSTHLTAWDLATPFAASRSILAGLPQHSPVMQNFTIKPASADAAFTPLPLQGYGSWLVETDSPAYRAVVAAQRRALIQSGKLAEDKPPYLDLVEEAGGNLRFLWCNHASLAELEPDLQAIAALPQADRPPIVLRRSQGASGNGEADIKTMLRRLGLTTLSEAEAAKLKPATAAKRGYRHLDLTNWISTRYAVIQVSNLHVEQLSSYSGDSMVWVTAIDSGKPVAGASVELWESGKAAVFSTVTDEQGRATLPERFHLNYNMAVKREIVVRHGEDVVLMDQYKGSEYVRHKVVVQSIIDRTLLHPGETVSFHHLARESDREGLRIPHMGEGWKLQIYLGSRISDQPIFEQPLTWSAAGSADSSWKIPTGARLGDYSYAILRRLASGENEVAERHNFVVQEFRTHNFDALFYGQTHWDGQKQTLQLNAELGYLSGGSAGRQVLRVTGKYAVMSEDRGDDFTFYKMPEQDVPLPAFPDLKLTLDDDGKGKLTLPAPNVKWPLNLQVEMQYADPNGEIQTQSDNVEVWPQKHKLGMKLEWAGASSGVQAEVLARDEDDHPLANQAVTISLSDAQHHVTPACTVKTDAQGLATCPLLGKTPEELDGWQISVEGADASGVTLPVDDYTYWPKPESTKLEAIELADKEAPKVGMPLRLLVHADALPSTLLVVRVLDGVVRSEVYQVQHADEIVDIPTSAADAPSLLLNTVLVHGTAATPIPGRDLAGPVQSKRFSILFDKSSALIDVAVHPAAASVLPGQSVQVAFKARVVDDGKPAAHAHLTVTVVDDALLQMLDNNSGDLLQWFWQKSRSNMDLSASDLSWYKGQLFAHPDRYISPVEQALEYYVSPDDMGFPWKTESESGIRGPLLPAAQSVLGYRGTTYAEGANSSQRIEITGSSIRMSDRVVPGKERDNFTSLALWKADLELDEHGEGKLTLAMPDNLTRWRIVAVAVSGPAHFGLGQASIMTAKPLQILSGLPQTLRSGDVLTQKLTLMNATKKPQQLELTAEAVSKRDPEQAGVVQVLSPRALAQAGLHFSRRIKLAAGESQVIGWPLTVPDHVTALEWHFAARAGARTLDSMAVTQSVTRAVPVTVREASLVHVDVDKSVAVAQPAGAQPMQGGVAVSWKGSLVEAALGGARHWMAQYPYQCFEQLSSKAVVSGDPEQWRQLMARLPVMLDDDGLVRYFPETSGSEVLTAYLLDIADAYDLSLPAAERERMQGALRTALAREVKGQEAERIGTQGRLARKLALQAAIAPDLHGVAPTVPQRLEDLPTIALIDWLRYIVVLPESPKRAVWLEAASTELRQRFDMQGTRLTLRRRADDNDWWFMWNADVVQARATLLIERSLKDQPRWLDAAPTLVASLVDMQREGHWRTTVANAWAGAASNEFARHAERGTVSGNSSAAFGGKEAHAEWPAPASALLPWPAQGSGDLELKHEGKGAPWATVQILAAVEQNKAVSHGLAIRKIIEPAEQKIKGHWSVGDIVRVKLVMSSDADLTWLAVRDPVPSGATLLGKGFKNDSSLARTSLRQAWWSPSSIELGNESYRGYYEYTWKGTWEAEYLMRLNNPGTFTLPATRIEAMYAPEIFGEVPNAVMEVAP